MTYEIEKISTSDLTPYARNARTHSPEQIEQIANSIKEFQFNNPVLIDVDNGIIAGHGRVLAADKLGMDKVPCIRLKHLSDEQKRAYIIADNQIGLTSGWNNDLLKLEITDLISLDFNVDLLGFSDAELSDILGFDEPAAGLTDEDETPEVEQEAITKTGDIWVLGKHRIKCGDSTNPLDVDSLLGDVKPHLMVTDPPYGVEYDANWRNERARASAGMGNRAIGAGAVGKVNNDNNADWSDAWALFPGDVAYVWCASLFSDVVINSLEKNLFKRRSLIIWAKNVFAISRCDYHWQHEPCWYAVKEGKTGHYNGDRKQTTIWQIDKPQKSETGHSTQKPVECMKRPIINNSSVGQAIYEPFSGSGTTIIACEETGRHCYAIELNPLYVDVAVKRWQNFTGLDAVLESTGETFNKLAGINE